MRIGLILDILNLVGKTDKSLSIAWVRDNPPWNHYDFRFGMVASSPSSSMDAGIQSQGCE